MRKRKPIDDAVHSVQRCKTSFRDEICRQRGGVVDSEFASRNYIHVCEATDE